MNATRIWRLGRIQRLAHAQGPKHMEPVLSKYMRSANVERTGSDLYCNLRRRKGQLLRKVLNCCEASSLQRRSVRQWGILNSLAEGLQAEVGRRTCSENAPPPLPPLLPLRVR